MSNNIFGGGDDKKKTEEFQSKVDTHSKAILTVVEKQKDIESKIDLLTDKVDLIDHNAIKNFKKVFSDIKSLRSDMTELKHEIEGMKEFNSKVTKQLKLMTTKDEVQKLEKYIDLWNPMDFVTRDELRESSDKIIDELRKIVEEFMKD